MKSKYTDTASVVQILACIYVQPDLLDNEKYSFIKEDFTEQFHNVIFGSMFNLYEMGVTSFSPSVIEDYLSDKPQHLTTYEANKGGEYLDKLADIAELSTFEYYYDKLKKMTLFRGYEKIGMDLSWLYDPDIVTDVKKAQKQAEWLDNTSIQEISDLIDKRIDKMKLKYLRNAASYAAQAGVGVKDLLKKLKDSPAFGYPIYGKYMNTVTRGAILGKYICISAASGVGKTRRMIGDACYFSCSKMYDIEKKEWEDIGTREPTLYISVEQSLDELQPSMIAFLSGVDEELILRGMTSDDDDELINVAVNELEYAPLYFENLPDFSMKGLENLIKANIRDHDVKYIMFDYLQTSVSMMREIGSTGMKGIREDNILFLLSSSLKELTLTYNVFIETATQLSGDYKNATMIDQTYIRGSKAIADRLDFGAVLANATPEDIMKVQDICKKGGFMIPNAKICIYKNRGNKYRDMILWCNNNKGICRLEPIFATDATGEFMELQDLKIKVSNEILASAF